MTRTTASRKRSARRRDDFADPDATYTALEAQWLAHDSGMSDTVYKTRTWPVADLVACEPVFQPRGLAEYAGDIQRSTDDLYQQLKDSPAQGAEGLEAVLVFPIAGKFYVIDGHCRLTAYQRFGLRSCKVSVFRGTFREAIDESLALNSKIKLPIPRRQRLENAWQKCKRDSLLPGAERQTAEKIARVCGIGSRTVDRMRQILRDALPEYPSYSPADIRSMSWGAVYLASRGRRDFERADKVRIVSQALEKGAGRYLRQDASLFWASARKGLGLDVTTKLHSYAYATKLPVLLGEADDPNSDF